MRPLALSVKNLQMRFGGLNAITSLSFEVNSNDIFGLIGPNGAGKTTVFNILTGVYQPTAGEIHIFGKTISNKKPYEFAKLGIARTFQNIRLFKELSVLENIFIPLEQQNNLSKKIFLWLFSSSKAKKKNKEISQKALFLLDLFGLADRKYFLAKNLPYGDQRRLEIARAVATGAKLILLDEPAAGLNPTETRSLMNLIETMRKDLNLTILLIEHDMKMVMGTCEKILVLDHGVKIAEGTPQTIQSDSNVIEAYLGKTK